jgi:hypothetical protein
MSKMHGFQFYSDQAQINSVHSPISVPTLVKSYTFHSSVLLKIENTLILHENLYIYAVL